MKLGKVKAGGIPLVTLALGGVMKPVFENLMSPVIGNGTVMSGGIKLVGAIAINRFVGGGMLSNAAQIALGVDGMEDIVHGVLGGGFMGMGGGGAW